MNPEILARLAQILPTLGRAGQTILQSKNIIPLLLGGGYLTHVGLEEYGKAGERKLTKAQMDLQDKILKASAEAQKRLYKESQTSKKEEKEQLITLIREQNKRDLEKEMMQSFTESQNRQMAMLLQTLQAAATPPAGAPRGGGMLNLVRSEF
jgi:hypothetical protein